MYIFFLHNGLRKKNVEKVDAIFFPLEVSFL